MQVRHEPRRQELEPIEAVIERVKPKLEDLIQRFRIPPEEAEDVLQETFLAFLQKRELIRNDEGWLVCVARRQCLRYLRSRRDHFYTSLDTALLASDAPQERASLWSDLNRAISRIPQRCRSVLRLRYRLGYKSAEVAEEMGCKPASVRKVASRCLAALSRQILIGGDK